MLKSNTESKLYQPELERQDNTTLRRRAADDAAKDADSYARKTWPQHEKGGGFTGLGMVAEVFCPKRERDGGGSPDGIDGLLIHSVGGTTSDELLEIFLAAKAEALAAESIRIFRDNIFWSGKYVNWMKRTL